MGSVGESEIHRDTERQESRKAGRREGSKVRQGLSSKGLGCRIRYETIR
jgi:hypothetical protein